MLKTPDLPLATAAIVGNPFRNFSDFMQDNFFVLSKDDEISKFTEANDNEWIDDIYYIRHPKKMKTDILIPANKFHEYIVREQIADMISYIRANLNVKTLDIKITKENNTEVNISGIIEKIPTEGDAKILKKSEHTVTIKCERPLKPSEKKSVYTWVDDFPHLISSIDNADNGSFDITESFDLSFGMSVKAAKAAGANVGWNATHSFSLHVTAA